MNESNHATFIEQLRTYYKVVFRVFYSRGFSVDESRDLTQDVFLQATRSISRFRHESTLNTWLYSIAMNILKNRLRYEHAKKREADMVWLDDHPLDHPALQIPQSQELLPDRQLLNAEKVQFIRKTLPELPDRMRACCHLRFFEQQSYQEIASHLQITPETVRSQVSQGIAKIRAKWRLADRYSLGEELDEA
ncbi:Sigma-70 family RNA polymerase sigma factor [Sulfidibacter corallicola]|uniref:Sigma-70 family RNA polymerase sigma factor n=1 Tax=Sulfidibacter corallicola TaxID=2818388 RepID=A0A8A4TQU4_SULCO|nr:sigma-70 family RNA polymerase sigma factor [Sulfidibacter corallicola]QTD51462.1 sigma-70 family RNA polymerase sigma factor [Sulfidibacter corallicola]